MLPSIVWGSVYHWVGFFRKWYSYMNRPRTIPLSKDFLLNHYLSNDLTICSNFLLAKRAQALSIFNVYGRRQKLICIFWLVILRPQANKTDAKDDHKESWHWITNTLKMSTNAIRNAMFAFWVKLMCLILVVPSMIFKTSAICMIIF